VIAFRDFVPATLEKRMLGLLREYERLHEVVTRVNRWIEAEGVHVLTVETMLLPVGAEEADTTSKSYLPEVLGTPASLQVVRVWYHEGRHPDYTGVTRRLSDEQAP
jgi:hypothetical protein